jgi:hypothetical protein
VRATSLEYSQRNREPLWDGGGGRPRGESSLRRCRGRGRPPVTGVRTHRSPESVLTGHRSPYSVGGGGDSGIRRVGSRRVGTGTGHERGRVETEEERREEATASCKCNGLYGPPVCTGRPFIRVVPGLTRRAGSSTHARPDGRVGPGTTRVLPCRAGLATGQNSAGPRAAWWARTVWTTIGINIHSTFFLKFLNH